MPRSLMPGTVPDGFPILVTVTHATTCPRLVATRADAQVTWRQDDVSLDQQPPNWHAVLGRNLATPDGR